MTALDQYERLEATGLWRESKASQSIEVLIKFGNTSLILSDFTGNPITHWSLPAVRRLNKGKMPAIYSPNASGVETLEIEDDAMVLAIEKVRKSLSSRRPRQGRLRILTLLMTLIIISLLVTFWLPNILIKHTSSLVYNEQREQIGRELLENVAKLIGPSCTADREINPLSQLEKRLFPNSSVKIYIFPDGIKTSTNLPGQIIILNQSVVEDFETPDVVAGFSIIEKIRIDQNDPIEKLLTFAGTSAVLKFLTTGKLSKQTLEEYVKNILTFEPIMPENNLIISEFKLRDINLHPYAYAVDITGETNPELVKDIYNTKSRQILSEQEWLSLQGICGG